jgi:hypothetical protein
MSTTINPLSGDSSTVTAEADGPLLSENASEEITRMVDLLQAVIPVLDKITGDDEEGNSLNMWIERAVKGEFDAIPEVTQRAMLLSFYEIGKSVRIYLPNFVESRLKTSEGAMNADELQELQALQADLYRVVELNRADSVSIKGPQRKPTILSQSHHMTQKTCLRKSMMPSKSLRRC